MHLELLAVLQYIARAGLLAHNHVLLLAAFEHAQFVLAIEWFVGAAGDAVVLFVQSAHKVEIGELFIASIELFAIGGKVPELVGARAIFADRHRFLMRLTSSRVWSSKVIEQHRILLLVNTPLRVMRRLRVNVLCGDQLAQQQREDP